VLYGSPSGLDPTGDQLFSDADFAGSVESDDLFGVSLAAGHFDRPGALQCAFAPTSDACADTDDLAIGVAGQRVAGAGGTWQEAAGKIVVAYGKRGHGLETAQRERFDQSNLRGAVPESRDHFGFPLVAGGLDGYDLSGSYRASDLLVGVTEEDVGGSADQGVVHLLFGGDSRLGTYRDQLQFERQGYVPTRDTPAIGSAAAIGDFDGDGIGDLALGAPGRAFVQILFGAVREKP
jgi:hypothetical protein